MNSSITHHTIQLIVTNNTGQINQQATKERCAQVERVNRPLAMLRSFELAVLAMTPDFFAEGSGMDAARKMVWPAIKNAQYLISVIPTAYPGNISKTLPSNWHNGYDGVCIGVMLDDHATINEKLEQLRQVPAAFRMIHLAPDIDPVRLDGKLADIHWVISASTDAASIDAVTAICRQARVACLTLGRERENDPLPEHPFGEKIVLRRPMLKDLPVTPMSAIFTPTASSAEDDDVPENALQGTEPPAALDPPFTPWTEHDDLSLDESAVEAPASLVADCPTEDSDEPNRADEVPVCADACATTTHLQQHDSFPARSAAASAQSDAVGDTQEESARRAENSVPSDATVAPSSDEPEFLPFTVIPSQRSFYGGARTIAPGDNAVLLAPATGDSCDLASLARVVTTGLELLRKADNAAVVVGRALLEIRDRKLWRSTAHKTWAEYCRAEFDLVKAHVNRLIKSYDVIGRIARAAPNGAAGLLPRFESQCRHLSLLKEPSSVFKAWTLAVQLAGGYQPTAKVVKEVVSSMMKNGGKAAMKSDLSKSKGDIAQSKNVTKPRTSEVVAEPTQAMNHIAVAYFSLLNAVEEARPMSDIKRLCHNLGALLDLPDKAA